MNDTVIAAIDQGTTSTRCMIFDRQGRTRSLAQREHHQVFPQPGWAEQDADEIWRHVQRLVPEALAQAGLDRRQVAALGIANQRETTVVWDRTTGKSVAPAITWQDTRTSDLVDDLVAKGATDKVMAVTGLQPRTYFAGPRLRWLLDHRRGLRQRAEAGELLFGTMESWLIWNLTGGVDGGVHVTDVTNASRTMLMDLSTGQWDELDARPARHPSRRTARASAPTPRSTARASTRCRACRSRAPSATSRRRCSARPASSPATPSAPTAPARSC